ncbi:MAG: VWA domain-containing protein, partial [Candidatus Poribacteria bacterium]|nr:VWA domain-containing protein [Candidatus Poribacteria bacterium]
ARMRWSVTLRVLAVGLIVAALAEPYWQRMRARMSVVALLDVSDSLSADAQHRAWERVAVYLDALPDNAEVSTVAFGAEPFVATGFGAPRDNKPSRLQERLAQRVVSTSATSLSDAITHAANLLPPSGERRLLLVSDGAETAGDALSVVARLRAEGIRLDALPVETSSVNDARLIEIRAQPRARLGETIPISFVIESGREIAATLRLSDSGNPVTEAPITLSRGRQTVEIPASIQTSGEHRFDAQLIVPDDSVLTNNGATVFVDAAGETRALYVQGGTRPTAVQSVATTASIRWRVMSPDALPTRFADMDAIVFDNVSATDLTVAQMTALQQFVREGGGWLSIGGDATFGAGGWRETPLETAAPIEMVPQEKRKPLALLLLLDKSGSMAHESGGVQKLTLAAAATRAALDALDDADRIGVIAFDAKPRTVVELSPKSERASILRAVEDLKPGAGTEIVPALNAALDMLINVDYPRQHILLLSDGQSEGEIEAAALRLSEAGITVSTIAVGVDARATLEAVALAGRGSFYPLEDMGRLPRIFAEEARQDGDVVVQEPTQVVAALASPLVEGDFPPIQGYLASSPKPTAQVFLQTVEGDPLLVGWRYGAGRAMAFLSDGGNRWATDWAIRDDFAARWAAWLRWTLPSRDTDAFDAQIAVVGSELRVHVAYPPDESVRQPPMLELITPNDDHRPVAMTRDEGGFSTRLPLESAGVHTVIVSDENDALRRKIAYFANAESLIASDPSLLRQLAERTGGTISPDPTVWARPTREGVFGEEPLSAPLLAAGFVLVLLEWVVRQFALVGRRMSAVRERSPESASRGTRLANAKRRASPTDAPSAIVDVGSRLRHAKTRAQVGR